MAANATFQQGYGLDTVLVAFSATVAAGTIRDGKTDIVTSAAAPGSGVFTFTLAKKFPQMVAGVASITPADASPSDSVCTTEYNATTGVVTVRTITTTTPTDPEAASRINFIGVFCTKDSLKDS